MSRKDFTQNNRISIIRSHNDSTERQPCACSGVLDVMELSVIALLFNLIV